MCGAREVYQNETRAPSIHKDRQDHVRLRVSSPVLGRSSTGGTRVPVHPRESTPAREETSSRVDPLRSFLCSLLFARGVSAVRVQRRQNARRDSSWAARATSESHPGRESSIHRVWWGRPGRPPAPVGGDGRSKRRKIFCSIHYNALLAQLAERKTFNLNLERISCGRGFDPHTEYYSGIV